jgi:hypothetical protein
MSITSANITPASAASGIFSISELPTTREGLGFRVQDSRFRVLGFWGSGLGSGV